MATRLVFPGAAAVYARARDRRLTGFSGARSVAHSGLKWKVALLSMVWPVFAHAQASPELIAAQASPSVGQKQNVEKQLSEIRAMKQDLARQKGALEASMGALETRMGALDARMGALEAELGAAPVASGPAPIITVPVREQTAAPAPGLGTYEFGKGLVLARGDQGELDWSMVTYVRYLNQENLKNTFTDAFGRTNTLNLREDFQFAKVTMNFKGWLFDENFRYLVFLWTSNASLGQGAQVVIAGNLSYTFNKHLTVAGGIGALPTTRTTLYTYPNWLRVDNRTIADEFFRGSYTTGIWAQGEIVDRLYYRAMLANNLNQLGVDAGQLDPGLNTVSAALWWMPTTGEYGPGMGFGDFENHQKPATVFGMSFTQSREDAESQPGVNEFENSQVRLSDGTRLFQPDAFNTGAQVEKATYKMFSVNAGVKYRGWTLDAEYYHRWLDNFEVIGGTIPVDELKDYGFSLQASAMAIPETLQVYASGSKIFGEYGDPSDIALGLNWFPFKRREVRLNAQALYLDRSPVGYASVPMVVGGEGWVFTTDAVLAF